MSPSSHRLLRTSRHLALGLVLVYSIAHFFESATGGLRTAAVDRCTGDFVGTFPAAFFRPVNPALFDQLPIVTEKVEGFWTYGPVYHVVTLPLLLLPDLGALCSVWMLANLLFAAAAAYLLFFTLFPYAAVTWPLVVLYASLWLNFFPLFEALRQGVIEIFGLLLVVGVYVCLARQQSSLLPTRARRDSAAGVLVACATMTKFLPGIFFPYLFIKKRWRALLIGIACLLGIAVVFQFLFDWRLNYILARRLDFVNDTMLDPRSQSARSMVLRLFAYFPQGLSKTIVPVVRPENRAAALLAARLGLVVAMALFSLLFFLRRRSPRVDVECALLVAFMIFVPQYNWLHYQVFLILPVCVMLKLLWRGEAKSKSLWLLFGALYGSTGSIIVPSSLVDRVLRLDPGGSQRALQNLSLPAFGNLGFLVFFALVYAWPFGLEEAESRWRPADARGGAGADERVTRGSTRAVSAAHRLVFWYGSLLGVATLWLAAAGKESAGLLAAAIVVLTVLLTHGLKPHAGSRSRLALMLIVGPVVTAGLVLPYRWKVQSERIASVLIPPEEVGLVDPAFIWLQDHSSPYASVAFMKGRVWNRSSPYTLTRVEVETEPSLGFANTYLWLRIPPGQIRDFQRYVYIKPGKGDRWPASTPDTVSLLSQWMGSPKPRRQFGSGAFSMQIEARVVGTKGERQ